MINIHVILARLKTYFQCDADSDLAELLEMSKHALSNHKSRDSIPYAKIVSLCRRYDLSLDWVFSGVSYEAVTLETGDLCSDTNPAPAAVIGLPVSKKEPHHHLKNLRVFDDTMNPTFAVGDMLFIEPFSVQKSQPIQAGIYALFVEEHLIVRRLEALPQGRIKVSPDNKFYSSFELEKDESSGLYRIWGRVVWHWKRLA